VKNDEEHPLRLIAFAEPPAPEKSGPAQLHVYIVNESAATLAILNELDSINIPQDLHHDEVPDADLMHIDFGVSGAATYVQVPPGECVKTTLLLGEEQLALLVRVKHMKTAVKFRDGGDEKGKVTTVLLPAIEYRTHPS
jgi:hypothetical protein